MFRFRIGYSFRFRGVCAAADPCAAVAAAAGAALGAICAHCGYSGLRDLVAGNGDYVVDGVCRQLRHLDSYPRRAHKPCDLD